MGRNGEKWGEKGGKLEILGKINWEKNRDLGKIGGKWGKFGEKKGKKRKKGGGLGKNGDFWDVLGYLGFWG